MNFRNDLHKSKDFRTKFLSNQQIVPLISQAFSMYFDMYEYRYDMGCYKAYQNLEKSLLVEEVSYNTNLCLYRQM